MDNEEKDFNNELALRNEWYEEASKRIKSEKDLRSFYKKLFVNHKNHTYNTMCYAAAAFSIAAANLASYNLGMSGFQMSCVAWDVLTKLSLFEDSCGLSIVEYEKMLYPQYEYKFEKTISKDVWELIQKKAKEKLKDTSHFIHPDIIAHLQKIVDGEVPFGYTVK